MGSMPRTLDIIIREDLVERVKAGDKCEFTGTLIVIPDVAQLGLPGNKLERSSGRDFGSRKREPFASSITGIKGLGVRELSYKLSFAACMVMTAGTVFENGGNFIPEEELTIDSFSPEEKMDILAMKNMPNLYQRLVESIAPSIFGIAGL